MAQIDLRKHETYIIERVLEYGRDEGIAWLQETYSSAAIQRVVLHSRRISRKTASYWALYFGFCKEDTAAYREALPLFPGR